MRLFVFGVWVVLLFVACAQPPVTPTPIQYPPTWTLTPVQSASPIPPTATLVIQHTPGALPTAAGPVRRVPRTPRAGMGLWVETANLATHLDKELTPRAQIVTGPRALTFRAKNPTAVALLRLDAADAQAVSQMTSLDARYAGVLIENIGINAENMRATTESQLVQARAALDTRLLIAATYAWQDGATYFEHQADATALAEKVDGICLCDFLRQAGTGVEEFKTEAEWKKDVDALAALSANPDLIILAAVPFAKVESQDMPRVRVWLDYALASFLLGVNNNHAFFNIRGERADDLMASPILTATVGIPQGRYFKLSGIYQRRFSKALVLVNPSRETRKLTLSRFWNTLANDPIDRVTLGPNSGLILFEPQ